MQSLCSESDLRTARNWPKIRKMTMTLQFSDLTSSSNFLFLYSSLVTGPSFMSISSLVLELWQFYFLRHWPESGDRNTPSGFWPRSGDGGALWIPNLAQMTPIEYYWMLQHARGYSFNRFWVMKRKPTGSGVKLPPPQIRVKRSIQFLKPFNY